MQRVAANESGEKDFIQTLQEGRARTLPFDRQEVFLSSEPSHYLTSCTCARGIIGGEGPSPDAT